MTKVYEALKQAEAERKQQGERVSPFHLFRAPAAPAEAEASPTPPSTPPHTSNDHTHPHRGARAHRRAGSR